MALEPERNQREYSRDILRREDSETSSLLPMALVVAVLLGAFFMFFPRSGQVDERPTPTVERTAPGPIAPTVPSVPVAPKQP